MNYFFIIFNLIIYVILTFFVQNYQSKLPRAKESVVSTNMTRGTVPIHGSFHIWVNVNDTLMRHLLLTKIFNKKRIYPFVDLVFVSISYLPIFLFWWKNHQKNQTMIVHNDSTWKRIHIFSNWREKFPWSTMC